MRMRVRRRDDGFARPSDPGADRPPAATRTVGPVPQGGVPVARSRGDLLRTPSAGALLGLQGAVGNHAVAQLLAARPTAVQRHSEDEAARGVVADDEGTVGVQREATGSLSVQRDVRSVSDVKSTFDAKLAQGKDVAVNYLKSRYGLTTKPYVLSVADLGSPHTHALTGGGWNAAGTRFTDISVRVNEPYLDRQAATENGFNKLVHTLGHEYQHVKQRSQKGWRTTDDASAKGEREFLAYSWEVLDAAATKRMAPLARPELLATIGRALDMYAQMDPALQQKHDRRQQQLLTLRMQTEGRFF